MKCSEPVRVDAIAEVKRSLSIPLVANGDICSVADADARFEATGCDGMMTARSILTNPALFAGYDKTPLCCLQDFLDLSAKAGPNIIFQCFHHHLTFMTDSLLRKKERIRLNSLTRKEQVLEFMAENFGITPTTVDENVEERPEIRYNYDETKFRERLCRDVFQGGEIVQEYCSTKQDGKYFQSIVRASQGDETNCDLDFMDSNMFEP
jgi:tRNA-dihydrouridine synthase 4